MEVPPPAPIAKDFDIVLEVLIAQLNLIGVLESADIRNMGRRLREAGKPHLADAVEGVMLANLLDTPDARRGIMAVVPDGGNAPD